MELAKEDGNSSLRDGEVRPEEFITATLLESIENLHKAFQNLTRHFCNLYNIMDDQYAHFELCMTALTWAPPNVLGGTWKMNREVPSLHRHANRRRNSNRSPPEHTGAGHKERNRRQQFEINSQNQDFNRSTLQRRNQPQANRSDSSEIPKQSRSSLLMQIRSKMNQPITGEGKAIPMKIET
ncbi:hypothetical protein YC2023_085537 [Brassica napus]